eukprot:9257861-Ditylum_brightwellii.AAC.1
MEKKKPAPKVCKKLTQNKIMSSSSAKTLPWKKKQAHLAKMKCTPSPVARVNPSPSQLIREEPPLSPVARGKPSPSSVARGKPCKKPGLNTRCGKIPNELLEEEMKITCKRTHDEWKNE